MACFTSGHVIISNSTSGAFLAVADCFAAAGFAAGAWANADAAERSAMAGIVAIIFRMSLSLELLELVFRLVVVRVEFDRFLERLHRGGLVVLLLVRLGER